MAGSSAERAYHGARTAARGTDRGAGARAARAGYPRAVPWVEWALPILVVAGGEIALGLFGLRVLWWVVCGWRGYAQAPTEPDGGGGLPLRVIEGGVRRGARGGLRRAA
jgi:hypothetical protein